jgi:beta-ureidopropionase / N-carbamoyl-L-amino-acid hydrolase
MAALQPVLSRLQSTLDAFASEEVGGTPRGGVSRPAASDQDKAARDLFAVTARDLGLRVRVDDVGNMYARRPGTSAEALPVVIGSHLDTVVPGGRFDGILGVTVALETIAVLNDAELQTTRPIEVVNWTGEEGARFPPAMIGSGVATGVWDGDYARSRTDAAGLTLGGELERIGYLGKATNRLGAFFASLEAHIEQGTQLEEADADVGIVPVIEPVRWFRVQVAGVGGHAGGPGPTGRKEAMVAASRMIVAARDSSIAATDFKTTVGTLAVEPGSNNVIPHAVTFNLDIRAADDALLDARLAGLRSVFGSIAAEEGVQVGIDLAWAMPGTSFDENIRARLQRSAQARGVRWALTRGAIGHDSLYLAAMGPAAMLFTRTDRGLSHCEEESAPWDAVLATAGVFADTTLALANSESLADLVPRQELRENA